MRQEKKYTFSLANLSNVRKSIQDSSYAISKSYNNRYVNSLYLDSFNYSNYEENLTGLSRRSKARLRWYSDSPFSIISSSTDIFFEIKIRENLFGDKLIHKINFPDNLILCDSISMMNHLRQTLPVKFLPYIDHCSIFSLGVSYEREYYETFTKKIRATIDKNITFARLNNFEVLNFKQLETYKVEYGILELKFIQNVYNEIPDIQFDGVEITSGRHSKYTVGLNLISK